MTETKKIEGLTPLERELLDALEKAAFYIGDIAGDRGEIFRQKHLQPVIDKVNNIRETERQRLWRSV